MIAKQMERIAGTEFLSDFTFPIVREASPSLRVDIVLNSLFRNDLKGTHFSPLLECRPVTAYLFRRYNSVALCFGHSDWPIRVALIRPKLNVARQAFAVVRQEGFFHLTLETFPFNFLCLETFLKLFWAAK